MMHSFEVEGIVKLGAGLEKVVVGKILEIQKHPNADKLQVVKLQTTNQKLKTIQVVCGAHNIQVGVKVPVALAGANLPGGLEIKEAEIRGVKSFGMLCAEDELGLGADHSGILILDDKSKIGTGAAKVLGLDDAILEIKVLPDRAHDALSHTGMAREITALESKKLRYSFPELEISGKAKNIKIKIEAKELCSRYIGAVVGGVEIKESPAWVRNILKSLGIRPINNVVDATNYVMLELGQPLHAFDLDKISKAETNKVNIIVRRAKENEEIKLLDGSIKKLSKDDLVIANEKNILALAGVMGGAAAAISNETKMIFLEAANFNAAAIRKTKTRLHLPTDAAARFEKELDPNLAAAAMARVLEILESFGGKAEAAADVYLKKVLPWTIKLDLEYAASILGEKIPVKNVTEILNSLGMKISGRWKAISVAVPTFRLDVKTQEDLIEEIGRVYGYEKIKNRAPRVSLAAAGISESRLLERKAKNILAGGGFSEVYNYSFYGVADAGLAELGVVKHLELANPINPDQNLLRVSLVPGLIKNIRENLKNFKEFQIFETGKVYWPNGGALPEEKKMLAGALVLEKEKTKGENFYALKGCVDQLLSALGAADFYYGDFNGSPLETFDLLWHAGRRAEVRVEGDEQVVGYVGEINPLILVNFDVHKRVAMFEFDLEKLRKISRKEKTYRALRKYPTVTRDISLLAGETLRAEDVIKIIRRAGGVLVLGAYLFDIFSKENQNSLAFRVEFGADRTLESQEVEEIMQKIILELEKSLQVEIRK